jgi:hypothetical protein
MAIREYLNQYHDLYDEVSQEVHNHHLDYKILELSLRHHQLSHMKHLVLQLQKQLVVFLFQYSKYDVVHQLILHIRKFG